MRRTFLLGTAVVIALIICPAVPAASVYRWVDEHGRVQYGDRPPEEGATKVDIAKPLEADPDLAREKETARKLLETFDEQRKEEKQQKMEAESQAQLHKKNCERAKRDLDAMRTAGFLYKPTADPANPRILTDEERAMAIQAAEAMARQWCK